MNWTLSAFTDEAGAECSAQVQAAKRAGLNFVDLRSVDGHNITVLPVEQAQKVKEQLDAAGLRVQMFGSPIGKIDISEDLESDLERLRHLGKLKDILGCDAVRIFSFYNKENVPHEEWQKESLRRLNVLKELAAELGLVLYHENERHIFGDMLEDVAAIASLRSDNFKLIFDFDNYNQGHQDVWACWERLKSVTDSFHLKDSTPTESGFAHVPIGQGSGQAEKILRDAVASGWSGPVALEPHLSHSKAVAATGPSGIVNEAFSGMPTAESFHVAAETAHKLLADIGAQVS